jgi:hypothetical protein
MSNNDKFTSMIRAQAEEMLFLRQEKLNLFHENTSLRILLAKSKRFNRSIFWLSLVLLISLFLQQYLYSKVKEENIRLKSQISNESSTYGNKQ